MEKKKSFKKFLFYFFAILFIVIMVGLPFLLEAAKNAVSGRESYLSAKVEKGSISKTISGTGTITDEEAVEIELPYGVEITKYLVSNNDFVTEGTPLCEVDRVDVTKSINELRKDMEYVEKQMRQYLDNGASNFLTTSSKGRVMELNAAVGDEIADVMLEKGCLAVISLDGLLAVDIDSEGITVGSSFGIEAPDGSVVSGRVESKKQGVAVITLPQEGRAVGEEVRVLAMDGTLIDTGTLYVHSPLKISGYSGTIEAVHVKLDQDLTAGQTLFTYSGNKNSAEYEVYAAKHRELEDITEQLFKMYTDGTINAPCDGVVTGIDEDAAAELLAADGEGAELSLLVGRAEKAQLVKLANEPEPFIYYRIGRITEISFGVEGTELHGTYKYSIADEKFETFEEAKNAVLPESLTRIDMPLDFAPKASYNGINSNNIMSAMASKLIFKYAYIPETGSDNLLSINIADSGSGDINFPSGGFSFGSLGGLGSMSAAMSSATAVYDYWPVTSTVPMSIVPQGTVTVDITVDELDILSIVMGQEAEITVDAIPGRSFAGRVTDIGVSGSNSGGNSKYIAEITFDRVQGMIEGMNATSMITLYTGDSLLTLPAEALSAAGKRTVVYTSYDAKTETLGDPVEVTTGLSDGLRVAILSGLKEGDVVWYKYFDKPSVELDFIPPNMA